MEISCRFLFGLLVLAVPIARANEDVVLNRSNFPGGFIFGAGSSAYQYEGAAKEGGKGPSIWDVYTHRHPEKIKDHSNGDVALDSYHRYKEDVEILKDIGMDAFRVSISWSRILPHGSLRGGINKQGIEHYNSVINDIVSKGLVPFVSLLHFDTPQGLEDDYRSFLSANIVIDFRDYANICFREFGDRVKHWITINEPGTYSSGAYAYGLLAPGRCSPWVGNCSAGNSGTEPYIAGHNMLLSHAAITKLYRDKYQANQKGIIGITHNSPWTIPYSASVSDEAAAQRAMDFVLGWFMEPLITGEYPLSMRSIVGNRLPKFTQEQSAMVKGSFDFIGLNYYTANYAYDVPPSNTINVSYATDSYVNNTEVRKGIPIGPKAGSSWQYVYPQGLRDLLVYVKRRYNNPVIYVTENGVSEWNNYALPLSEALQDSIRIEFHHSHLSFLRRAIREGVDVRGYFVWSLLDDFEWGDGYTVRFGLNYVDYEDGLKRYQKASAIWFQKFLKG